MVRASSFRKRSSQKFDDLEGRVETPCMRQLVLGIAALGIACANSRPTAPETARAAPDAAPTSPATTTPVVAAAEFAITKYVDESTRTHGTVCVELDRAGDPAKVLELLAPLASRLSVDRNDCRSEPSAILSIGQPQFQFIH